MSCQSLKQVSDWRLGEENQRAALARIVHGISRLDATAHWGDGRTSASDGQRFAMRHKVLQQTYSTRFNDFAPEFPFDPELIRHISPIEWQNVILYGEIKIDPEKLRMRRP